MSVDSTEEAVILIVDDIPTNLEMLLDFLEGAGFKVVVAEDGESAIEMAEYALPDLILLDVLMPGMDGFETCQRLKSNPTTQGVPVIFMTALTDGLEKIKGLSLGAVDYITKPLDHEEVLARVKIHLHLQNLTKRLTEQNERLKEQATLLDITTDAIFVWNLDNTIRYWNRGAERVYGWLSEEVLGKNADELLYRAEDLPQLKQGWTSLMKEGSWQSELRQLTQAGQEITVASRWTLVRDDQGQPKSILTVNTDITEKKQLERQFLRAQRLESIGTLAGGIAHDLNNILTPILTSAQLLQLKPLESNPKSQHWLQIIETNARRGAALVKQVLQFARGAEGKHEIVQLESLIQEVSQMAQKTFSKSIQCTANVDADLWSISGDSTHLHQVLMNLVVNARDALPAGGSLTMTAENVFIDEHYAQMNLGAAKGPYIKIAIADTGTGMPPETVDRIFEPFFTTKEVGKGTGLGLSTVQGIIKSHGGFINVQSKVGQGTEFRIFLPALGISETQGVDDLQPPQGQGEWILVVDDEVSILETTKITLETNNYKVLTVSNGIEAISLYAQHQEEIALVLIDMVMPSMDGPTAIRVLQRMSSPVKIVAVSGFVSTDKLEQTSDVNAFIAKPYTTKELLQTLRQVLDDPADTAASYPATNALSQP